MVWGVWSVANSICHTWLQFRLDCTKAQESPQGNWSHTPIAKRNRVPAKKDHAHHEIWQKSMMRLHVYFRFNHYSQSIRLRQVLHNSKKSNLFYGRFCFSVKFYRRCKTHVVQLDRWNYGCLISVVVDAVVSFVVAPPQHGRFSGPCAVGTPAWAKTHKSSRSVCQSEKDTDVRFHHYAHGNRTGRGHQQAQIKMNYYCHISPSYYQAYQRVTSAE